MLTVGGPVLGPMVLAGVAISEEKLPALKALGVKDSKLLSPKRREVLYKQIIELVDNYSIVEISPDEIDQKNADGTNLNQLEALKIAQILTELKPDKVYVDSPEPAKGGAKFGDMIASHLKGTSRGRSKATGELSEGAWPSPEIIAEHKADSRYEIASAASILAKVTRDNAVRCISNEIGYDIGSGYPSDPKCKAFLQNHYSDDKHIRHIRTCWATYKTLMKKKNQASLADW